jgi:HAE1 family hydrophobic/amphiphilic exporter-1
VRYDRERRASVQADFKPGVISGQANDAVAALPIMKALPQGVHQALSNNDEQQKELFGGMILAMLAGVGLIFVVMVLLFRSFFKPLTVFPVLLMSLGGAFFALFIARKAFDLPSMIGMLMLMGLSAKNSILLVEFAIERQREGMNRRDALLAACTERSRPIIMTTVAMIMGMAPTALGIGQGAEWRAPMSIAVIGGLISSTILSLVLVPVFYELFDNLERWLLRRFSGFVTDKDDVPHAIPEPAKAAE